MADFTLVSHDLCPYVQRAAIALAEKGVGFRRVNVDLSDKPDWFRAISPLGKVPLLRVGNDVLFESAAIVEYLEETTPHPLHPLDPIKRAALFIKMNDLVIQNAVVIPVLWRNGVSASTAKLRGMDLSGWDSTFWRLPYWHRQA